LSLERLESFSIQGLGDSAVAPIFIRPFFKHGTDGFLFTIIARNENDMVLTSLQLAALEDNGLAVYMYGVVVVINNKTRIS